MVCVFQASEGVDRATYTTGLFLPFVRPFVPLLVFVGTDG